MSFLGKYDLVELVSDEETRTFKAREVSSGDAVLVHQFVQGRTPQNKVDLVQLVLHFLRKASAESLGLIIDMGEHKNSMYVVTQVFPGFRTLRAWLEAEITKPPVAGTAVWRPGVLAHAEDVGGPAADVMPEMRDSIPAREGPPAPAPGGGESVIHLAPQSAAPIPFGESAQLPPQPETSITGPSPAQPLPPGRKAGEVTRIFRAWADESRADRRERVEPPSQPISPEVPAEPTRSFHPAESDGASMVPPLHAQTSHPPPERPLAPGEFTSIFGGAPTSSLAGAGPNRSEVAMPSFSPVREPGEFTRLFQGMSDGVQAPGPNQPQVELPAPGAPQEPGEFTRMFHSQGNLSSTPPDGVRRGPIIEPTPQPAPSPNGPGEFTRLFGSPHPVSKGSQQGGGQALQPPPASGASQVLKMPPSVPVSVQKRQAPKLVAPAAVPMPNVAPPKVDVQFPQVPKSGPSPLLLIVILGALSLAAIGMVLLFLLKH